MLDFGELDAVALESAELGDTGIAELDAVAVESTELGDSGIAELDGVEYDPALVDAAAIDAAAAEFGVDLSENGFSLTVPGVEQRSADL